MRLLALFSILLLIAALVLNVLLLLAGNRSSFLEHIDIVSLNTSDVGRTLLTSPSSPVNSAINGAINSNPEVSAVAAAFPQASQIANYLLQQNANSIAESIGLHDFYNFHVQNWCEGFYTPGPLASNATQNVTSCANSTALWNFNLTQILDSELRPGLSVAQLQIPEDVSNGFTLLQTTFKVMFIFYCITIGVTGLGILAALAALMLDGRISACLNGIWTLLNVLCSIVASGIATAIMVAAERVTAQYQDQIGIRATRGTQFLVMTWVATGLLVLAFLTWCVDCCVGGKDRKSRGRYRRAHKEQY